MPIEVVSEIRDQKSCLNKDFLEVLEVVLKGNWPMSADKYNAKLVEISVPKITQKKNDLVT